MESGDQSSCWVPAPWRATLAPCPAAAPEGQGQGSEAPRRGHTRPRAPPYGAVHSAPPGAGCHRPRNQQVAPPSRVRAPDWQGGTATIQLVTDSLQSGHFLCCRLNFSFINHPMEIHALHAQDLRLYKPDPGMNNRRPHSCQPTTGKEVGFWTPRAARHCAGDAPRPQPPPPAPGLGRSSGY